MTLGYKLDKTWGKSALWGPGVGWFKTPVSSQTHKLMEATKFSDYLGPKYYEKAKKSKHFTH